MQIDFKNIREQFPLLTEYPELIYLDNAATTQKPVEVISAISDFYTKFNANVHRGLYPLSETATEMYEMARQMVAKFLGAAPSEIIFTAGTTDGSNMLAGMLASQFERQIKVLATEDAHHSNILPWQQVAEAIKYIPLNSNYQLAVEEIAADLTEANFQPDVVAISLASNVTGAVADIKKIRRLFPNSILVVDAAQAVAHMQIDVKSLHIDFLIFSGHKLYGPMGIGVLYGKQDLLEKLPPVKVGGGMIREVKKDRASWAPLPERLEAGTPNVAGAVGLAAAINFVNRLGWDQIVENERTLISYTLAQLSEVPDINLYHANNGIGVFSFTINGIHPHDLAQLLGERNIAVRAGHHCTQILHKEVFEIPASTRASLAMYNNQEDIDKLILGIKSARAFIK